MATIHEMLRRVKTVDLTELGREVVSETKPEIIAKNREQLMDSGVNKEGVKLRRYRSNSYAARKHAINPFPGFGVPDLYRTGAFQEGMIVKLINKNSFEIDSTDSKTSDLKAKYGKDIFGFTTQSKDEYRAEVMQPALVKKVKQKLKL